MKNIINDTITSTTNNTEKVSVFADTLDMTICGIHCTSEHELFNCQDWNEKGYTPIIRHYGLYEIQKVNGSDKFKNDDEATIAAVKDGFRIIPECELPDDMTFRFFSYIDCQWNRDELARQFGKKEPVEAIALDSVLKEFHIPVRFTGRIVYAVTAKTEEKAKEIADGLAENAEMEDLEDIDWEVKDAVYITRVGKQ